jgi:hypothetical protein
MIEYIAPVVSVVSTTIELGKFGTTIYSTHEKIKAIFTSKYLCYDLAKLKSYYVNAKIVGKYIPYEELCNFIDKPIKKVIFHKANDFKLSDNNEPVIKLFQSDAFAEFKKNGKMSFDSQTVRLEYVELKNSILHLTIAKAKYSDQVQTHLVLDWSNEHLKEIGLASYRGFLKAIYSSELPPLNTPLLPNSIGISTILYFQKDGVLIPYLPLRNKSVFKKKKNEPALYEGVYTSSSSGVLEWTDKKFSMDYITSEMYREIEEELGIEKSDISLLQPIAITRELLRAGKPQIFYVGIINLEEEQLKAKREQAIIKNTKDPSAKVEIKNTHLSISELKSGMQNSILSLESLANLYYCERYFTNKTELLTL